MLDTELILKGLKEINAERSKAAFGMDVNEWEPYQWANALLGECGKLANFVKKLERDGYTNTPQAAPIPDSVLQPIELEVGDIVIYLDLLMARLGMDLYQQISVGVFVPCPAPITPYSMLSGRVGVEASDIFRVCANHNKWGLSAPEKSNSLHAHIGRLTNRIWCRLVWLCQALKIDLCQCVVKSFNGKSEQMGVPYLIAAIRKEGGSYGGTKTN